MTESLSTMVNLQLETLSGMMSKRVTNGREGGLMIDGHNDIKTDDD